ncbi:MAG: PD-(D/E)XK nuclease family protein [Brevinema sp.]
MQFLLGHFGSGKTSTIVEQISNLITQNQSFWVIVPSRQHKDALIKSLLQKKASIIGNPIITLREFQEKLIEELFPNPIDRPQTLTNFDQFLIISHIIRKNEKDFKAFKNITSRPKIIQMIYRIIYALRDRNIDNLESTEELKDRVHDLRLILDEFDQILNKKNLSDTKYSVNLIAQKMDLLSKSFFPDYLFVDGFIDYTPNQFKLISSSLLKAQEFDKNLLVSFLNIAHETCHNTLAQFQSLFPKAEEILAKTPHVGQNLVDQFLIKDSSSTSKIAIHEIQAFGKHREVEEITNQIKKLTSNKEYSLNDILIIAKNQDIYAPLFQIVFRKAGIPYQTSKDMLLSDNPLIQFIKKLLSLAKDQISHESLDFLAHSNYISPKIRSIFMQAPELIPLAIVGGKEAWNDGFARLTEMDINIDEKTLQLKNTIFALCEHLYALKSHTDYSVNEYIEYISNLLNFLGVEEAFVKPDHSSEQTLIEDSLARDYAALAKLKEVFANISNSLNQIQQEKLSMDSFLFYFQMIISETRYRSSIPYQNRVRIVSPEDARGLFVKATFIVGMNEGEFPAPKKFDLFDNQDRVALNLISHTIFGKALWSTEQEYFSEEKLSFAVSLSRASEEVYFSRTPSNERGIYSQSSYFLQRILAKQEKFERIPYHKENKLDPSWDNPKIFDIAYEPSHYFEDSLIPYAHKSQSTDLREAVEYLKTIERVNEAYKEETPVQDEGLAYFGQLSAENKFTKDFNQSTISFSPTALESLGRCRYRGLWERLCRLKPYELPSYQPENLDYGNLYHYVLEHYIAQTKDLPAEDCIDIQKMKSILDEFINQSPYKQVFLIDYEYIVTILTKYLEIREKDFRESQTPLFFEAVSGEGELENDLLQINENLTLKIRSKVDRVDQNRFEESYQIIDYKKRGRSYPDYQKTPFNLFQGFLYASLLQINDKNPVNGISYVLLETNDTFQEFPNKNLNSITEFSNFKKTELARLITLLSYGSFSPFTTAEDIGDELIELFNTHVNTKTKTPTEYKNKCSFCDFERICLRKQKLVSKE